MPDNKSLDTRVCQLTGARAVTGSELIQPLWSGYGRLLRVHLRGAAWPSVIVKQIRFHSSAAHPRGWNSRLSEQRKYHSYQVEAHWYRHYARCTADAGCPLPRFIAGEQVADEQNAGEQSVSSEPDAGSHAEPQMLLIISDLAADYPLLSPGARPDKHPTEAARNRLLAALAWLAQFHAIHLNTTPDGLWACGGYWHLATRPEELAAMTDKRLQLAAPWLDSQLSDCRWQTLVHGDSKLANFCFSPDNLSAAAVDFQYTGRGPGIKDVILLISSALPPEQCADAEPLLLEHYFSALRQALCRHQPQIDPDGPVNSWRALYATAWADFVRFLDGWSPQHWKISPYSQALTRQALTRQTMLRHSS